MAKFTSAIVDKCDGCSPNRLGTAAGAIGPKFLMQSNKIGIEVSKYYFFTAQLCHSQHQACKYNAVTHHWCAKVGTGYVHRCQWWGVKHMVAHRFARAKSGGPCVAQPGKPKCASGFTSSHYSDAEQYLGRAVCGHHALKMDGHSRSLRLQDAVFETLCLPGKLGGLHSLLTGTRWTGEARPCARMFKSLAIPRVHWPHNICTLRKHWM